MTEVQKYLLKLIKEIDEICLANDIDYYIFAGSMLGLERNEGFLPWDDDIDLIMTEKNYQKFIQVMRDDPPPNRIFECREDNPEYPLQFGKYMSTDMTGLIRPHAFGNAASGLWIDIVHVVPAPVSKRRIEFIKKWFSCYCEVDNEIYVEHMNHYEGFYWRYRLCLLLIRIFGKKRIDRWAKKLFASYPEEKCTQYLMYHCLYTDYRFFDKKHFAKPERRLYEGEELSALPFNREFSRLLFGDSWMMVPKVDDRDVHTMVVDFDIPYHRYVDDYMIFMNKEEMMDVAKKSKKLQMKNIILRRQYIKRSTNIRALLINDKITSYVKKNSIDLKKELEDGNIELIKKIFEEYEKLIFNDDVSYWKAYTRIDDELLYIYLKKAICYDGRYYTANKLLSMRENMDKTPLSEDLKSIKPLIDICRSLSVALWDDRDMAELEEIIKTQIEGNGYGFCIDFELAKIYLDMHKAASSEEYEAVRPKIAAVTDVLPDQGECIKILGDIEYAKGNAADAMAYYEEAEHITTNGLLLLDISKKKEEYYSENM